MVHSNGVHGPFGTDSHLVLNFGSKLVLEWILLFPITLKLNSALFNFGTAAFLYVLAFIIIFPASHLCNNRPGGNGETLSILYIDHRSGRCHIIYIMQQSHPPCSYVFTQCIHLPTFSPLNVRTCVRMHVRVHTHARTHTISQMSLWQFLKEPLLWL